MNEDRTKDLTLDEKLDLILTRLAALETQSEERSNTTRPLLDRAIQEMIQTREIVVERFDRLEERMANLERKFDILVDDSITLRAQQKSFEKRLNALERKTA